MNSSQKVTVSLPSEVLHFADKYKETHNIATRSEVLALALKLLREQELAKGYRAMSEAEVKKPDSWLDSDLKETLKAIEKG